MVVCWKWLYYPKKEGQNQMNCLSRRLSYKLPVVIRYNLIFSLLIGLSHAMLKRNAKIMIYYLKVTPFCALALCYEQIIKFYQILVPNTKLLAFPVLNKKRNRLQQTNNQSKQAH